MPLNEFRYIINMLFSEVSKLDKITKEQRSKNMRAVRNKDSKIEILLRKALWQKGYRYRKNYKKLPGKPDIVFNKAKVAVFCDSEFWHGYDWQIRKNDIKSNREFWIPKIEKNIARDIAVNEELQKRGYTVLRFWGKEIEKNLDRCVEAVVKAISHNNEESRTKNVL